MLPADRTKVPHTLLLADDSVTIQRVIELTFADEDIKVIAVSDGDQAIAQLDSAPPDIVLADIGMPGRNGYEVAEYIKQSPRLAHIPVVLLTGAFEPVDQVKATAAGCDGVLAKPFEPQLVIERVKELLARQGRLAPLAVNAVTLAPAVAAESWPTALIDPAPAGGHMPAGAAAKVDDYFDRLDAAFASLATGSSPELPMTNTSNSKGPDELDWFGSQVNSSPASTGDISMPPPALSTMPDLPLAYGSPPAGFDRAIIAAPAPPQFPAPERFAAPASPPAPAVPPPAAAAVPPPSAAAPATPAAPPLPPLADAFADLLSAEQGGPAPAWQAARVEGPAVTEDLIEQVTRRVLDRLSDRVVRETAADLVSAIAERLIREEIERIKASLK
jgi:CheY-like chemotaxis protein